jgi:hypothetical protein
MWWNGSKELWNDWTAAAGGFPQFDPITGYAIGNHNTVFYVSNAVLHEYLWNGSTTQNIQVQQLQYTPVGLATTLF